MQNAFKPFGEKGIDSFEAQFDRSRLVLTGVYVAMLFLILCISTSVTRTLFSRRLDVRFHPVLGEEIMIREDRLLPPDPSVVRKDLAEVLFLANGSLLVLAGISSYWLAGITLRPIKHAYQKQRQFLSDASHELRTPLAILQADLENARTHATGEHREQIISHLEEVERMGRLVNDLLTLSRFGEQVSVNTPQVVSVKRVVEKTFERLALLAKEKRVSLELKEGASLQKVFCEEDLLLQAMTNIVKNAILYNKESGQVSVALKEEGDAIVTTITDTGVGMSKEDVVHVFDRFYRADQSRSRASGGSGLGLSIAQAMIEEAGGSILLTSSLGKGTMVVITLPIHKAS